MPLPSDQIINALGQSGYALSFQLLGNHQDAEDMTQDSLNTLVAKWDTFDESKASVKTWFLTIVRNRTIDYMRKKKPQFNADILDQSSDRKAETAQQHIEASERQTIVRDAVVALPQNQRELILLRDYHGFKYAEIAKILNVPIGTIMSRLSRVRNQLRLQLFDLEGILDD
jgi:RNA polymerase sigma-70 factor (ECF subfamily)